MTLRYVRSTRSDNGMLLLPVAAFALLGAIGTRELHAQAQFANFTGDGLWATVGNWANTPDNGPPSGDHAWINVPGSGPATIDAAVPDVNEIIIGQGGGDGHVILVEGGSINAGPVNMAWGEGRNGTWEQSGGTATVGQIRAGREAGGDTATIVITGGTLTSTADIRLSDFDANTDANSSLTITGGTLETTAPGGLLAIGVRPGGTGVGRGAFTIGGDATLNLFANVAMRPGEGNSFTVLGSNATINVNRPDSTGFEVHQDNDVNFVFDAGGISTVNITAEMRWSHADSNLNVDATEFFGSQVFDLFTFSGYFEVPDVPKQFGTENLTFRDDHTGWVNYTDTSIEIDIRLLGDANLDSTVTIADLGILAANWQQSGVGWEQGDFSLDGSVTIADLGILAANWQAGANGGSMNFDEALAMFDVFDGVVVPEPGALGLLCTAGLMLIRRRTGRKR